MEQSSSEKHVLGPAFGRRHVGKPGSHAVKDAKMVKSQASPVGGSQSE